MAFIKLMKKHFDGRVVQNIAGKFKHLNLGQKKTVIIELIQEGLFHSGSAQNDFKLHEFTSEFPRNLWLGFWKFCSFRELFRNIS